MSGILNIVLAGVGGQGTLVAGKLLGAAAEQMGLDVKVSEVHGMAQRGGSVITYVRMGEKVYSPMVETATADFILAFEELEALRWAGLLRRDGAILVNTRRINPMTVATGQMEYPPDITGQLRQTAADQADVFAFDALALAEKAGSSRAVNVVMVGALSRLLDFPPAVYDQAIDQVFAAKYRAINHAAFQAGSAIIEETKSGRS
jgi:indolepyruvate ferredoxin oxidoreductase, beta subunit